MAVKQSPKRYLHISIVHIIAAIMIVFCHIFQASPNVRIQMLGQFLIVGNSIFFFVSGILANKSEYIWKDWYLGKMRRILIPMWIWETIVLCAKSIAGLPGGGTIRNIMILLFNMQGFFYVSDEFGHLWYVTALAIFYLLVPLLHSVKRKKTFLTGVVCIQVALLWVNDRLAIYCSYFIVFSVGYLFSSVFAQEKRITICKEMILLCIAGCMAIGGRMITHWKIDGSVLYSACVVQWQQHIVALAIFYVIWMFSILFSRKRMEFGWLYKIEKITFFLYLVHPSFIKGVFAISFTNLLFQVLFVFGMSILSGFILMKLVEQLMCVRRVE